MLLSSFCKGVAANSWLAFMDQLLVLGDSSADVKDCMKEKMLKLIDVCYDALDSAKSGKKVSFATCISVSYVLKCYVILHLQVTILSLMEFFPYLTWSG